MTELVILLAVLIAYGAWEALKLIWRLTLWATKPIRDEIAYQRMVREERKKEQRIIEAHREAVQGIDAAVASYVDRHERALAQLDDESRRRQSDPSSEDTIAASPDPEQCTYEAQQVVEAAPQGYYWSWCVDPVTGMVTIRAGRRKNAPKKRP